MIESCLFNNILNVKFIKDFVLDLISPKSSALSRIDSCLFLGLGLFIWAEVISVTEKTFRQVYKRDFALL